MTTRQKFEQMLYDMGIFATQAKQIMDFAIAEIDKQRTDEDHYRITWDRPAYEYPEAFYSLVFWVKIKPQVFAWAEQNMPMAWWKPMFGENMTV